MVNEKQDSKKPLLLLCEDDDLIDATIRILCEEKWRLERVKTAKELLTLEHINPSSVQLLVMDLCHEDDPEGLESISLIPEIRAHYKGAELLVQSGLDDVDKMRQCIRQGAAQFVLKDRIAEFFPILLERHREFHKLKQELDIELLGQSPVMNELKRELLRMRLESHFDILIEGETGTGKELCARALHAGKGPFVAVNVSAVPPDLFEAEFFGSEKGAFTGASQVRAGYLEQAGEGTLFLDEIQELPLFHQAKLLRVIESRRFQRVGASQDRPFKARVISAANQSLKGLVSLSKFREDLYFRLAPINIQIPPLRMRGADIPMLAQHFLGEIKDSSPKRFSSEALLYLRDSYDWPGNVRELRGLVRMLCLKTPIPVIGVEELSLALEAEADTRMSEYSQSLASKSGDLSSNESRFEIDWDLGLDKNVERLEAYMLREAMHRCEKSSDARELLKVARSRFYEKLKQHRT